MYRPSGFLNILALILALALNPRNYDVLADQTGWLQTISYAGSDSNCVGDLIQITHQGIGVCFQSDKSLWSKIAAVEINGVISTTTETFTDATCGSIEDTNSFEYTSSQCTASGDDYALVTYTFGATEPSYPSKSYGPIVTSFSNTDCSDTSYNKLLLSSSSCTEDSGNHYTWECNSTAAYQQYYSDNVCSFGSETTQKMTTKIPSDCADVNSDTINDQVTCKSKKKSSKSRCFSVSETLELETGERVSISNVKISDRVLIASMMDDVSGKYTTLFSEVIAYPHAVGNQEPATFIHIVTESGHDIKMTGEHLIIGGACNTSMSPLSLVQADSLTMNDCVLTHTHGVVKIRSISPVEGKGIYTVVTKDDGLLVVNGIVASPFAVNHYIANTFYNIHRMLYSFIPALATSSLYIKTVNIVGDIATKNLF